MNTLDIFPPCLFVSVGHLLAFFGEMDVVNPPVAGRLAFVDIALLDQLVDDRGDRRFAQIQGLGQTGKAQVAVLVDDADVLELGEVDLRRADLTTLKLDMLCSLRKAA